MNSDKVVYTTRDAILALGSRHDKMRRAAQDLLDALDSVVVAADELREVIRRDGKEPGDHASG